MLSSNQQIQLWAAHYALVQNNHTTALALLTEVARTLPKSCPEWSKVMLAIKMTRKGGKIIDHV